MRTVALLLCGSLLAGCASQIMQNYVGKPLSDAVSDYGPPVYSFDTGPGERAFLWSMNNSFVLPGTTTTNASVAVYGNTAQLYGTTTTNPPVSVSQQCTYAVYAKRTRSDIEGPAAWTVTGFKKPRIDCE
jgi:hypothetical protein